MITKVNVGDLVVRQSHFYGGIYVFPILKIGKKTVTTRFDPLGRIDNFRVYDKEKVERIQTLARQAEECQKEARQIFESLDTIKTSED